MRESLERETAGSNLISAAGAWLALGAGLALMSLALLAVLGSAFAVGTGGSPHEVLIKVLTPDLTSALAGGVKVQDQGNELHITVAAREPEAEPLTITYLCVNDQLVRQTSADGGRRFIGRCPGLRFSVSDGKVVATWQHEIGKRQTVWALNRWWAR